METKLIAADIATAAGVTTIITSSRKPENIFGIIEYHQLNSPKTFSVPSTPRQPSSDPAPISSLHPTSEASRSSSPFVPRPPHTVFTASPTPLRDLKSWTSHTLFPSGSVIIDAGAHLVLSHRESGGRLLAAGVLGVIGAFASGQAVRICIRRGDHVTSSSHEAAREKYAKGLGLTRPATPVMDSPDASPQMLQGNEDNVDRSTALGSDVMEADRNQEYTEADVIEVGRGLANYNSAQIARTKGLNRCVHLILLGTTRRTDSVTYLALY
jgi:glutamate 5-kinase